MSGKPLRRTSTRDGETPRGTPTVKTLGNRKQRPS